MNEQNWERYRELRDLVLDEQANESQTAEIEEFIASNKLMKRDFAEYCQMRSAIAYPADNYVETSNVELRSVTMSRWWRSPWPAYAGMAAAVLVAAMIILNDFKVGHVASVGTIVKTQSCQWEYCTVPTVPGRPLLPGRLILASGIAELQVGLVDLTMEGPADVELISSDSCFVRSGRVFAKVQPGGEGFVVKTPTSVLTDRGTVFGVSVTPWGTSELTVVKGQVDAMHIRTGKSVSVMTHDSLRLTETGIEGLQNELAEPGKNESLEAQPVDDELIVQISTAIGKGRDGYVMASDEPIDKQSRTSLLVKKPGLENWAVPFRRRAYMHFDLSLLSGQKITSAKLQLKGVATNIGFLSRTLDTHFAVYGLLDESLEDWSERSLDWETCPGMLEDRVTMDTQKTKLLGQFVVPQADPLGVFTISGPKLHEFLRADTNGGATLILVSETEGIGGSYVHGFASKRHPELAPPTLRLGLLE